MKALYPPPGVLLKTLETDNRAYQAALHALGVDFEAAEPITACAARYEAELDLRSAAAELGLTAEQLLAALPRLGSRSDALAPLRIAHGRVKRDSFTALFPVLISQVGTGTAIRTLTQPEPVRSSCGTEPGSVEERIEDCAFAFADARTWDGQPRAHRSSDKGEWSLVLLDGRRVMWREDGSGALWAAPGVELSQRSALELCIGRARTDFLDAAWTLPLAREVLAAREHGLPLELSEIWSQDVDNSQKYRSGGITVGAQRTRVASESESSAVACLARGARR